MSTRITISCYAEELRFSDSTGFAKTLTVPFRHPDQLQEHWIELVRQLGNLKEKYNPKIKLSVVERDIILAHFARIGSKLANLLFPEGWSVIWSYLQLFPRADIDVHYYVWIPWEIFYYGEDLDQPTYQGFCGYQHTIYRVTKQKETVYSKIGKPQLGFLPFSGWSKGSIMSSAKDIEEVGFESIEDKIIWKEFSALNPEKRRQREIKRLRNYLMEADLVHFSSLIIPVLEHSFLLLDNGFWLSIDDFEKIIPNENFILSNSPLIFFNVRDNYTRNPLHILKYIEVFHRLEALGVITSTLPIPNYLAAQFSEQFYKNLLQEEQFIGQALAETKRYFMDQLKNPFALFYVSYLSPTSQIINEAKNVEAEPLPDKYSISPSTTTQISRSLSRPTKGEPTMSGLDLSYDDRKRLSEELQKWPTWLFGDKQGERSALIAAGLPQDWVMGFPLTGMAVIDTPIVISQLEKIEHLQARPTYHALGAFVEHLLHNTPHVEGKLFLANLINHYQLITNLDYLEQLRQKYALLRRPASGSLLDLGWQIKQPDFVWQGPTSPSELEAIWGKKAPFLDAVFLEKGAKVARSVCRVEVEDVNDTAYGTGFLIAPNLVLTNDHVVPTDEEAKSTQVRFGYRIDRSGQLQQGEIYQVKQALRRSPIEELDYVVLELEDSPGAKDEIGYLKRVAATLKKNQSAYIIQHPNAEPQKVVLQENWITYVAHDQRRVQYLTNTKHGSSGSPVCNEKWEVVALHHSGAPIPSSVSNIFVSGNEGIPMAAIWPEIEDLLP